MSFSQAAFRLYWYVERESVKTTETEENFRENRVPR